LALVLPPKLADEIAGALVERPVPKTMPPALAKKASQIIPVEHHDISQDGDGTFVLSLQADDGTMQTFKMSVQRVRKLRDTLSALIARNLVKKQH
jgi:transketolase C-terminal domain/subunit